MADYRAYFAIEKKLRANRCTLSRAELVSDFTNGKKTGLKELSRHEYFSFLKWLQVGLINRNTDIEGRENTMRRKLIAILKHQMGYTMADIDQWCIQRGFGIKLNDNNYNQLVKLVTGAERMYAQAQKQLAQ